MKMKTIIVLATLILVIVLVPAWTLSQKHETAMKNDPMRVAYSAVQARNEAINAELEVLRRRFPDETRMSAALYILGELRASSAVEAIADELMFSPAKHAGEFLNSSEFRWAKYPAQDALIKIGAPAIPVMIRKLKKTDDEIERKIAAQVLLFVLMQQVNARDAIMIAREMLEREGERQINPVELQRLQRAIMLFPIPQSE